MSNSLKGIRPFIGAKNFDVSRSFYRDLGFVETRLGATFSVFEKEKLAFYLQDAYVKDWIENSMLFLEVEDVEKQYADLKGLDLQVKYADVKLTPIRHYDWGKECFLHDPSGVLWHIGEFNR